MKPITHPAFPTEHSASLICDLCKKEETLDFIYNMNHLANEALKQRDEAIQRVRELHQRELYDDGSIPGCECGCGGDSDYEEYICSECGVRYPCPTIEALDGEK